jgi:ABC-type multidrug transport system fused ATPase/permease subunit
VFDAVVSRARRQGLVKDRRQLKDATHIIANIAIPSTIRQAQIVVLDEPTSFMDSWAENEWLGRFRTLVHGRTALILTHRFTTAMQADIIHVMDGGRIIASGTHAELLQLGGEYAAS